MKMQLNNETMYERHVSDLEYMELFYHDIVFGETCSMRTIQYEGRLKGLTPSFRYNDFKKTYKESFKRLLQAFLGELNDALGEHCSILNSQRMKLTLYIAKNDNCYFRVDSDMLRTLYEELPKRIYNDCENVVKEYLTNLNIIATYVSMELKVLVNDVCNVDEFKFNELKAN